MRGESSGQGVALTTFLTLYLLGILNVFLRNSMGVLGPEVAVELSVEPAMLGAVASAFFFAYALMQIPTGILLDRCGARPTLCGLMVLTTMGALLFAMSTSETLLVLSRILMGAGCAGCFTGAFFIFARRVPRSRFAFHGGLFNSIAMTGTLFAASPLALVTAGIGWHRTALLMAAMTGIALLLAWAVLDDAAPSTHREPPEPAESFAQSVGGLAQVARIPGMGRLACTGIGMSAAPVISSLWGGPYLYDVQGLDEVGRGHVLLFMATLGVASHFTLGQLAARLETLRGVILGSTAVVILALGLLAGLDHPPVWLVALLFGVISFGCGYPAIVHAHIRAMVPERLIGRGITLITMGVMGIVALMQLLVGAIVDAFAQEANGIAPQIGYQAAFGFMALAALAGAIFYAGIGKGGAPAARGA